MKASICYLLLLGGLPAGVNAQTSQPGGPMDVQYLYFSLPTYREAGSAGVIQDTFLVKPNETWSLRLQSAERLAAARGWPEVPEKRIHFGAGLSTTKALVAIDGDRTITCPVGFQDVASVTQSGSSAPRRVLAFRGCPFRIGKLATESRVKLRTPNEIEIESADGAILFPRETSLVPFLATETALEFLCWNVVNSQLKFLHAGTIFETDDAVYKVAIDGGRIWFAETGAARLEGIEKLPQAPAARAPAGSPASAPADGKDVPPRVSDAQARVLKISLRGNSFYVGDTPDMACLYDATGQLPNTGAMLLSADRTNVILDFSGLPVRLHTYALGAQIGSDGRDFATVSLASLTCQKVFIDQTGIAYPDDVRTLDDGGPFVVITFETTRGGAVHLSDCQIDVREKKTDAALTWRPLTDDTLVVERIGGGPMTVRITDKASKQSWSGTLFPKFRSARPGLVVYRVQNVVLN